MASMDKYLVSFFGDSDSDSTSSDAGLATASPIDSGISVNDNDNSLSAAATIPADSSSASSRHASSRRRRRQQAKMAAQSECLDSADNSSSSSSSSNSTGQHKRMHNSKSCGALLLPSSLPPENDEGNVEYKLKLVRPTPSRLEHLVTQLKWRLAEGQGQAVYELGVEDNGVVLGLSKQELNESVKTLGVMCDRLNASCTVLRERPVAGGTRKAQEILIRRLPNDKIDLVESRLAVLGNLDAGKSTLLGVLTQGDLDNGRGRARLNLFRHPHEIQTGYTSSVSSELLGFDARGNVVNYSGNRCVEDILEESSKLYRLIDLAGHIRYQKTTLRGLTAHDPHLVVLVVSSVTGLTDMAQEHAALAIGLQVPFIVVITKIDLCDHGPVLASVEAWLKSTGNKRVPLVVLNKDDAITAAGNMHHHHHGNACGPDRVTPIFPLSCVTGAGLDRLTDFLNVLHGPPPRPLQQQQQQGHQEFCVDSVACLDRRHGNRYVLSGPVLSGRLREGDLLQLGPGVDGVYVPVRVTGLNRNRLPCGAVQAGHWASVTVALQLGGRSWGAHPPGRVAESFARRGAFLVALNSRPPAVISFSAEVCLHAAAATAAASAKPLRPGCRLNALCGSVCQQVRLMTDYPWPSSSSSSASGGKRRPQHQLQQQAPAAAAIVRLSFVKQAELVRLGDRLVLRDGHRVVGVGRIVKAVNLHEA